MSAPLRSSTAAIVCILQPGWRTKQGMLVDVAIIIVIIIIIIIIIAVVH
jgi:hypothetical protein